MSHLTAIRRFFWVVPVLLGIVFIGAGAYMVSEGRSAKDEVRSALVAEQITTSKDASIPSTLVTNVDTAQAQEAIITEHTRGKWGPYSQIDRTDPNRATYLDGVALRTALNLAVMGFKVSDLVIGMGAFLVAVGLTNVFVLAPVVFWLRQPAPTGEKATGRKPVTRTPGLPAPTGA
jgi:hypothetical protein